MITELDIHLPLARALREDARRKAAAQKLQISPHRIKGMRLVKESIDARRRPICKQLRLLVGDLWTEAIVIVWESHGQLCNSRNRCQQTASDNSIF